MDKAPPSNSYSTTSLVATNQSATPHSGQWKSNEFSSDLLQFSGRNPLLYIGLGIFLLLFSIFAFVVGFQLGGDNLVTNFPKADSLCDICSSSTDNANCLKYCKVLGNVDDCPSNIYKVSTVKRGAEEIKICQLDNTPSCIKPSDCNNWFDANGLSGYSAGCFDKNGNGNGVCVLEPFKTSKKTTYENGNVSYNSCDCLNSAIQLFDAKSGGKCTKSENSLKSINFVCSSCNNIAKFNCPAI